MSTALQYQKITRLCICTNQCSADLSKDAFLLSNDQAEDPVPGDGSVAAAVRRVHAIVSQEEELVFAANDELFLRSAKGIGWRAGGQIRFVKFASVNVNGPAFQINRVAGDSDDSFDGKSIVRRITNHDHIGTLWRSHVINPAIQKILLRVVQCGGHTSSHYANGLKEEMADNVVAEESERCHGRPMREMAKYGRGTFSVPSHWAGQRSSR